MLDKKEARAQSTTYLPIGTIHRAHGTEGHLLLHIAAHDVALDNLQTVFVQFGTTEVPYHVDEVTWQASHAILKLQGVDSRQAAYDLRGRAVSIPQAAVPQALPTTDISPLALIGYRVTDEREGDLGTITQLHALPMQTLLVTDYPVVELLIPYHRDLVKHIDHDQKQVTTELPIGFIDALR